MEMMKMKMKIEMTNGYDPLSSTEGERKECCRS